MQKKKFFALAFIMSLLLIGSLNALVLAQNKATVVVANPTGGTTDPSGTTTYDDGSTVTITATPNDGYGLLMWIVSSSAGSSNFLGNTLTFTASGGVTYNVQATFQPILPFPSTDLPPDLTNAAIVIVLAGSGGTTSPAPGTYALANAASTQLFATANSGWTFSHWVISGTPSTHGGYPVNYTPTDNPYSVGHGYGYTYYYQPVFTPTSTGTSPTPTATATPAPTAGGLTTDNWIFIGLIAIIIILLIALVFSLTRHKK